VAFYLENTFKVFMKIQVLGTGCPKCKKLTEYAEIAAKELNITCEIEKVTDIDAIMALGVMTTPALVVDGTIKSAGRLPSPTEIKEWLKG
jgi:small redox-active disulfide protein 2